MNNIAQQNRRTIYIAGRIGSDVKNAYNRFSLIAHYILDQGDVPINPLWLTYPIWKSFGDHNVDYASITIPLVNVADELWIINTHDLSDSLGTRQEFTLFTKTSKPIFLVYIVSPDKLRFRNLDLSIDWQDLIEIACDQRENLSTE